jgi:hypothetical protein
MFSSSYFPTFDSSILEEFEDILLNEEHVEDCEDNHDESNDEQEVTIPPVLQADSLNLKDLLHEMEKRRLEARGFFSDDAKLLQAALDKEHEEYIESKKRQRLEAKKLESAQKAAQRRKACTEYALLKEKEEAEKNDKVSQWFQLLEQGIAPSNCRIEVNNISARTLARMLWSDSSIMTLDVSNLNLSDDSGVYLGRALKNNKTIVKLDLGNNNFGSKTFCEISEALRNNSVVKYLSLESNHLAERERLGASEALANMIKQNKGLKYLSIWKCNLGVEGGQMISESIKDNHMLTCLEIGSNYFHCSDIKIIKDFLLRNREQERIELEGIKNFQRMEEEARILFEAKCNQDRKLEIDRAWLQDQKEIRAKERRELMELNRENAISKAMEITREKQEMERHSAREKDKRLKKKKKKKQQNKKVFSLFKFLQIIISSFS